MTALFWEQLVQEAEARGFYLCGVTASCSLLHTLSDKTYNLVRLLAQCSSYCCTVPKGPHKGYPGKGFYMDVMAVIPQTPQEPPIPHSLLAIAEQFMWSTEDMALLCKGSTLLRKHVYINTGTSPTVPEGLFFFFLFTLLTERTLFYASICPARFPTVKPLCLKLRANI